MGQPYGQGIRGVRDRRLCEPQQGAHHEGDLLFVGASPAHHRLFDAPRRIFVDGKPTVCSCQHGGAPGAPQNDGRLVALDKNDGLKGCRSRPVLFNQLANPGVDGQKTPGLEQVLPVFDDSPGERLRAAAPLNAPPGGALQHSVPSRTQGGVDGEDALGSGFNGVHLSNQSCAK